MGHAAPVPAGWPTDRHDLHRPAHLSPWDRHRRRTPREIADRFGLLSLIALAHLILLLLLLTAKNEHHADKASTIKLIAIADAEQLAAETGPSAPPSPPPPSPEPVEPAADLLVPAAIPIPAARPFAPDLSSLLAGGGGCALPIVIGRAIEADPAAMAFLDVLPVQLRTEADAVMLWNGSWMRATAGSGSEAMTPLRQIVVNVIRAAPSACVETETTGPRFIPLADGNRTLMLAVGSGVWRWADLVVNEPLPTPTGPAASSRLP